MSSDHFPDPDMPDHIDIRLLEDARTVPDEVVAAYGLGKSTITPLETGSFNIHFKVDLEGELFDLRKSNRPSQPGNLDYESEILVHLKKNGFTLSPQLVETESGALNLWSSGTGWALFKWIGDDSGTQRAIANSARARAAARVLADFHRVGQNFAPRARRGQWPIFTLPDVDPDVWLKRAGSLADHLQREGDDLRQLARQSAEELRLIDFTDLPEYLCHADYRMRNLQFTGDGITGLFDLDTSIRSTRLLDLSGAVTRFSPLGGDPQADVSAGAEFLTEYHNHFPLTKPEITALPTIIRWRLLREVVIYYDFWWRHVGTACVALFEGAAEEILSRSELS